MTVENIVPTTQRTSPVKSSYGIHWIFQEYATQELD